MPHVYTIQGAFGADEDNTAFPEPIVAPEIAKLNDEIEKVKKQRWFLAGGSALAGLLLGILVGVVVK
jgi:hypothetical protein